MAQLTYPAKKSAGRPGVTAPGNLTVGLPGRIYFSGQRFREVIGHAPYKHTLKKVKGAPNTALNTPRGVPSPGGHLTLIKNRRVS